MPTSKSAWLPVSASECTASARVADECERNAAANLAGRDRDVAGERGKDDFSAVGVGHAPVYSLSSWEPRASSSTSPGRGPPPFTTARRGRARRSSSRTEPAPRRRIRGWSVWPALSRRAASRSSRSTSSMPSPGAACPTRTTCSRPRGVRRWAPCARAARSPRGKLLIGGKSMGGRIATQVAAAPHAIGDLAGLVLLGYPLHPPGRPEKLRAAHLARVRGADAVRSGLARHVRNARRARTVRRAPGRARHADLRRSKAATTRSCLHESSGLDLEQVMARVADEVARFSA